MTESPFDRFPSEIEGSLCLNEDTLPTNHFVEPSCISALGPSSEPASIKHFAENRYIRVGTGEITNDLCGIITGAASCSDNPAHPHILFRHKCNNPRCPVCYQHYCDKAAHRVEDKLNGMRKAFRKAGIPVGKTRHVIFSAPPQEWPRELLEQDGGEAFRQSFNNVLKTHGRFYGGTPILHCERKKHSDGSECDVKRCNRHHTWVWGPHIHYVGWGYFDNSALVHSKTGWVYKVIDDGAQDRSIYQTVRYQLSHAATFRSGQMLVRYVGMATKGRKVEKSRHIDNVQCRICGADLHRRAIYPDGTLDLTADIGLCTHVRIDYEWVLRTKRLKHRQTSI